MGVEGAPPRCLSIVAMSWNALACSSDRRAAAGGDAGLADGLNGTPLLLLVLSFAVFVLLPLLLLLRDSAVLLSVVLLNAAWPGLLVEPALGELFVGTENGTEVVRVVERVGVGEEWVGEWVCVGPALVVVCVGVWWCVETEERADLRAATWALRDVSCVCMCVCVVWESGGVWTWKSVRTCAVP